MLYGPALVMVYLEAPQDFIRLLETSLDPACMTPTYTY